MNSQKSLEHGVGEFIAGSDIDIAGIKILGTDFARFYSVNSDSRVDDFMSDVSENFGTVLLEVPRLRNRPELDYKESYATHKLLGAYRFVHELKFANHMAPVVFASNTFFVHDDNLRPAEDCRFFDTAGVDAQIGTVRTWIDTTGNVFKSDLVSLDYFERSQVAQEAQFLNDVKENALESNLFPGVIHVSYGRAVVELVRSMVPGTALGQSDFGSAYLPKAFHSACLEYVEAGLFHNDLRPWNLLNDKGRIRLVDFADTSGRDADLTGITQVEAYIGTALVLMGKLQVTPQDFVRTIRLVIDEAWEPSWPSSPRDWAEMWLALPSNVDFNRFTAAWTLKEMIRDLMEQLMATERRNHG
jgi:hypothetical protein